MTENDDQWDPSRDIAEGSVAANAAKLFGAGGALAGGGGSTPKKKSKEPMPSVDEKKTSNGAIKSEAALKEADGEALQTEKTAEETAVQAQEEAEAAALVEKLKEEVMDAKKKVQEAEAAAKEVAAKEAAVKKKKKEDEEKAAKKKAEELLAKANAAEADERARAEKLAKLRKSHKLLLGRFDVSGSDGQPMRCTDNEILIRAIDVTSESGGDKHVVLQLLSDPKRLESELQARSSADEYDAENTKDSHIVEVLDVLCDASLSVTLPSKSPFQINYLNGLSEDVQTLLRTHGDSSQYDASGDVYGDDPHVKDDKAHYPCLLVLDHYEQTLESHTDRFPRPNLRLARGVAADVVVGLMMLHTEGKVH
eukprot:CAMPEP_0197434604 /NCGR_PEP_ID=MMETSP1175-20131217/2314_1 /TAXON_ID=1003142 /ORGANISM="Triceratium dubium, Strain CCMP147" /LENGTH=365 /DNA_ID=CAMNT_0042963385 /DNA_START=11 /DNA_END=1105 /DNA_ORIENTATION=+